MEPSWTKDRSAGVAFEHRTANVYPAAGLLGRFAVRVIVSDGRGGVDTGSFTENCLGLIQLACALLWYRRLYRLTAA